MVEPVRHDHDYSIEHPHHDMYDTIHPALHYDEHSHHEESHRQPVHHYDYDVPHHEFESHEHAEHDLQHDFEHDIWSHQFEEMAHDEHQIWDREHVDHHQPLLHDILHESFTHDAGHAGLFQDSH